MKTLILICFLGFIGTVNAQNNYSFELQRDKVDTYKFTVYVTSDSTVDLTRCIGIGFNILLTEGNKIGAFFDPNGNEWDVSTIYNTTHFKKLNMINDGKELMTISSEMFLKKEQSSKSVKRYKLVSFRVISLPKTGSITLVPNDHEYVKQFGESNYNISSYLNFSSENEVRTENRYVQNKGKYMYHFGKNDFSSNSTSIYPNPVDKKLTVTVADRDIGSYSIDLYSIDGRKIDYGKPILKSNYAELGLSKLKRGVYFLIVTSSDGIKNYFKVFKQ